MTVTKGPPQSFLAWLKMVLGKHKGKPMAAVEGEQDRALIAKTRRAPRR